jgi:enamine deaminase RidA (YjgF/YER057c/UK114 family)
MEMSAEQRLKNLGIVLPVASAPAGSYSKVVMLDGFAHLSGQGPRNPDGSPMTGQVPTDRSVEEAVAAARNVGFQALAVLRESLGSLDRVAQVVRTFGMVNAVPGFTQHPKVIDGFSNLMIEIFGEAGRGARSAVGMGSLPFNISVEVEMTVKVKDV